MDLAMYLRISRISADEGVDNVIDRVGASPVHNTTPGTPSAGPNWWDGGGERNETKRLLSLGVAIANHGKRDGRRREGRECLRVPAWRSSRRPWSCVGAQGRGGWCSSNNGGSRTTSFILKDLPGFWMRCFFLGGGRLARQRPSVVWAVAMEKEKKVMKGTDTRRTTKSTG